MLNVYEDLQSKKKYFLTNDEVNTEQEWDAFVKRIKGDNFVFRGVKDYSWKMYSSLQRDWDERHQVGSFNRINKRFTDHYSFAQYLVDVVKESSELTCFLSGDGIEINSMALLQHYEYPSMLIDFSYDLEVALFFMTENVTADYCSLYYINAENQFLNNCTLEDINTEALKKIEEMASQYDLKYSQYINMLKDLKDLPISEYKRIDYIVVRGGTNNPTVSKSTDLGVQYTYNFINPRMNQQKGLFFLNTTKDTPLEELLEKKQYVFINCVNVCKNVVSHIKNNYVSPNVTKDSLYYPTRGAKAIKEIFDNLEKQKKI